MSGTVFAPGETVGAAELTRAGLLLLGEKAAIHATAVFVPADAEGTVRRIEIGSGVRVGAYALICGGACIGGNAQVEEHTIVGKPEKGYAVSQFYPGTGAHTRICPSVVLQPDREQLGLCDPPGARRPKDMGGLQREHTGFGLFTRAEAPQLTMPDGYPRTRYRSASTALLLVNTPSWPYA